MPACPSALPIKTLPAGILNGLARPLMIWLCVAIASLACTQATEERSTEDRLLVKPKENVDAALLSRFHLQQHTELLRTFRSLGNIHVLKLSKGQRAQQLISRYQQSSLVEYAEPDYRVHLARSPNDPKYLDGTLWALNNLGQNGGLADADIDAPEGWEAWTSASNV